VSYTVALSTGNGSYTQREMKSGSHILDYNIYTNSGHTTIWGNGSSGNSTNSGSFTASGGNTSFTAYGEVPAQAGPASGSYTDSITVTVTY
jgi:spore coat protein U-like protein